MKSLRDEIRLAAGEKDGFNFIQAFGLDFICIADFILAEARISLKDAQPGVISRLGILNFQGVFPLQIVGFVDVIDLRHFFLYNPRVFRYNYSAELCKPASRVV